jgi:hypothetical protein
MLGKKYQIPALSDSFWLIYIFLVVFSSVDGWHTTASIHRKIPAFSANSVSEHYITTSLEIRSEISRHSGTLTAVLLYNINTFHHYCRMLFLGLRTIPRAVSISAVNC